MGLLLCALVFLFQLAVLVLVLWVVWWIARELLTLAGVAVPGQVVRLVQIILVLIVLIILVRALMAGDLCGVVWLRPIMRTSL